MRRLVVVLVALGALLHAASGQAEEPPEQLGVFRHEVHAKVHARDSLECVACHQVGGGLDLDLPDEALDEAFLEPPPGACHHCHDRDVRSGGFAPTACETCHTEVQAPDTHGAGWMPQHGIDARYEGGACLDCHKQPFCVECHERKDRVRTTTHDPTWLSIHGIAVRAAPATCDGCHLQQDCVRCHQSAAGRAP